MLELLLGDMAARADGAARGDRYCTDGASEMADPGIAVGGYGRADAVKARASNDAV
jgi:hypothetical protein